MKGTNMKGYFDHGEQNDYEAIQETEWRNDEECLDLDELWPDEDIFDEDYEDDYPEEDEDYIDGADGYGHEYEHYYEG
jgi:hypothetical protein